MLQKPKISGFGARPQFVEFEKRKTAKSRYTAHTIAKNSPFMASFLPLFRQKCVHFSPKMVYVINMIKHKRKYHFWQKGRIWGQKQDQKYSFYKLAR